ncbi:MAG TPA: RNA-binding protein, partial [Bacteroidales bacterium]|nr:RNA-binding protein [Bacteroidales bacterium]
DKLSGRSRGFGFVEMDVEAEATKAIEELNEADYDGKTIQVSIAKPKTEGANNKRSFNNDRRNFRRN